MLVAQQLAYQGRCENRPRDLARFSPGVRGVADDVVNSGREDGRTSDVRLIAAST